MAVLQIFLFATGLWLACVAEASVAADRMRAEIVQSALDAAAQEVANG